MPTLEPVTGTLELVMSTLECVMFSLEPVRGTLESVTGTLQRVMFSLESVTGTLQVLMLAFTGSMRRFFILCSRWKSKLVWQEAKKKIMGDFYNPLEESFSLKWWSWELLI